MMPNKYEINVRLVIHANSQSEAEEMATVKLRDWMGDSIDHNRGVGFLPGNLVYWDIRKEKANAK